MRAIAESVDSDTLRATTWVEWVFSSFTMSSMAPTLFGKKTENCRTCGPPIFEVVSGKSRAILPFPRCGKFGLAGGEISHCWKFVGKHIAPHSAVHFSAAS